MIAKLCTTTTYATLAILLAAGIAGAQVGALDASFDADGKQVVDFSDRDYARAAVVAADGTLFVVGDSQTNGSDPNTRDARLVRFAADGSQTGSWTYGQSACGGSVPQGYYSVELEADGHLLAGGYTQTLCSGSTRDFWLLRLTQDGTETERFDQPDLGVTDYAFDVELLPDGTVVAAGFTSTSSSSITRNIAVVRYLNDGTVDESGFGTDGMVTIDINGENDHLRSVKRQPDGKLVGAGFATISTLRDMVLVRLEADGSPDTSFGVNGVVIVDYYGYDDEGRDLVLLPDGKIVVVGSRTLADGSTSQLIAARFEADGSLDTSFGVDGTVGVDFGGPAAWGRSILRQLDGKLVVGGTTETGIGGEESRDFAVARLLPDGSLDPSFDGDGMNTVDFAGSQRDDLEGLAIAPDGDIVAVGFTEVPGSNLEDMVVARFIGDSPTVQPIFADGFESGSFDMWSAVVGGP